MQNVLISIRVLSLGWKKSCSKEKSLVLIVTIVVTHNDNDNGSATR